MSIFRRKKSRHAATGQGRVIDFSASLEAEESKRRRRFMGRMVLLAVIFVVILGIFRNSLMGMKETLDSLRIRMLPTVSLPQQTGLSEVYQAEKLDNCFVVLGKEGCIVYGNGGSRINSIQSGYAHPTLAVGKTRFVLYNRSGNELRVESRTGALYTKNTDNSIYRCAISGNGTLAVVTRDIRYTAALTVFSPSSEEILTWQMNAEEGTPMQLAFASDNHRLAVATVTATEGRPVSNLYLLDTRQQETQQIASVENTLPLWIGWRGSELLALFEDHVSLYSISGIERLRYDFSEQEPESFSVSDDGIALLFRTASACRALVLNRTLTVLYEGEVREANRISMGSDNFYLLTDSEVLCYDTKGNLLGTDRRQTEPQFLLQAKEPLLFTGNTMDTLRPTKNG